MNKKNLNNLITMELKKFGIRRARLGSDFEYNYEENTVYYTTTPAVADKDFSDFLMDRFDYEDKYPFMMSLLHEVGHAKNNDDVVDDVYAFCLGEKFKIQKEIFKTSDYDRIKVLNYRYFSLPDEIMATAWAVNYIKRHKKKVAKLEKIFQNAIDNYNNR